jgi:hypothetical protein
MNVQVSNVFQTGQTAVSTSTPTQLSATPGFRLRQGVTVLALAGNTGNIFIGPSNEVTIDDGFPLVPGVGVNIGIDQTDKIWCIADSGTCTIAFIGS